MYLSRVLSVTVAAACVAALPTTATAAARGDDPGYRHHHGGPTRIVICKHGLDTFDVYADGESLRQAGLSQGRKRCTHWKPVSPGIYDIAFAQRVASQEKVTILAHLSIRGKTRTRVFEGQGVINTLVRRGETVRLDLETRRCCGR